MKKKCYAVAVILNRDIADLISEQGESQYKNMHLSSECYETLRDAQAFIEERADKPEKLGAMLYKSKQHTYEIHELVFMTDID